MTTTTTSTTGPALGSTSLSAPRDVQVLCLTPDFAAGLYSRLRSAQFTPRTLIGSTVVVSTDGSEGHIEALRSFVRSIGVAPDTAVRLLPTP